MTGNIANTILCYPTAVALPAEPFGERIVPWAEFAEANPDIADVERAEAEALIAAGDAAEGGAS